MQTCHSGEALAVFPLYRSVVHCWQKFHLKWGCGQESMTNADEHPSSSVKASAPEIMTARDQWTNTDLLLIDPFGLNCSSFKWKRGHFHTAKLDENASASEKRMSYCLGFTGLNFYWNSTVHYRNIITFGFMNTDNSIPRFLNTRTFRHFEMLKAQVAINRCRDQHGFVNRVRNVLGAKLLVPVFSIYQVIATDVRISGA